MKPLLVTQEQARKLYAIIGYLDGTRLLKISGPGVSVTNTAIVIAPPPPRRRVSVPDTTGESTSIPASTLQGQVYQALADGGVDGWDYPMGHE